MAFSKAHTTELVPPLCSIRKYVVLQRHENSFVVVWRLQSYSGMKFILITKIISISPKQQMQLELRSKNVLSESCIMTLA